MSQHNYGTATVLSYLLAASVQYPREVLSFNYLYSGLLDLGVTWKFEETRKETVMGQNELFRVLYLTFDFRTRAFLGRLGQLFLFV